MYIHINNHKARLDLQIILNTLLKRHEFNSINMETENASIIIMVHGQSVPMHLLGHYNLPSLMD